jgi:hypothetical protein
MQHIKQNLLPLMTWLSFIVLAFSTMTEVRSFNRNEPGFFSGKTAPKDNLIHASKSHEER